MAANNSEEGSSTAVSSEEVERVSGKELLPQMGALTTELYRSQYEAAKFFEIAYYSVSNFPDVAVEVRLSAHQARTSHELSVSLMKKFSVTGNQIVDRVIPLIIKSLDLGKDKIVKSYFTMVIKWSNDMEQQAEDTRKRYLELQGKLQTDIELIRKKRGAVITERQELSLKMKQEQDLAKEAKRVKEELQAEREMAQRELDELRNVRRTVTQSLGVGGNTDNSYLGVAMMPGVGMGTAALASATYIWHGIEQGKQLRSMMKMLIKTQHSIDKASDRHLQLVFESQRRSKEVIERMHTMKQLYLRNELLGDESSLLEAVHRIGQADQYLAKMARFWANMVVLLMHLKNETVLGEPFLEDLSEPACAEIFKEIMEEAKEKWSRFAEVCGNYVMLSETDPELSINKLYGFLDGHVDRLNAQQRMAKMEEIQDEFVMKYAIEAVSENDQA